MGDHPIYILKKPQKFKSVLVTEILTPKFLVSSSVRDEYDYLKESKMYHFSLISRSSLIIG